MKRNLPSLNNEVDTNLLYFGNNLTVMRENILDNSVDLVYADPPFNSARNYFVIFKDRTGSPSQAQTQAFEDTWHWGEESDRLFRELVRECRNANVVEAIKAIRMLLGETAMTAYLVSMTGRFVEIHRVLKSTGSFYLHCDSTASHYVKIILDSVFGVQCFRSEIIWKRTSAHSSAKRYGPVHDVILFYTKSAQYVWNPQFTAHAPEYVEKFYRHIDTDGRRYTLSDLMAAGVRNGSSGKSWRGIDPASKNNHWKYTIEKLDELDAIGRIYWPNKSDGVPRYKRYLDEVSGIAVQDVIDDISPISAHAAERLGYPTQKPVALLKRFVEASTNPGDVVLDCYCGCGTAVAAAHELGRRWIGIDIAPVATAIMRKRMTDTFDDLAKSGVPIVGFPTDLEGAKMLFEEDPYLFQSWACIEVGAYPLLKKGADNGIDGFLNFADYDDSFHRAIVQVKGGKNVGSALVRDFVGTMTREKAKLGFFVTLAEPTKAMRDEALKAGVWESVIGKEYPRVQLLTVAGLLSGQQAPKLPPQEKRSLLGYSAKKGKRKGEQAAMDFTE